MNRRRFVETGALAGAGLVVPSLGHLAGVARPAGGRLPPPYRISLAGWSLNRRHFREGKLPALDFPQVAREEYGIEAIELVNTMLPSPTYRFLQQLGQRAAQHDVAILLIMCDAEGDLSSEDDAQRLLAVRNHHKWVDIAAILGCHSIRVNSGGRAGDEGDMRRCGDSLRRLAEYAAPQGINVIVENHGGLSSHPASLVRAIELAARANVGTLPDFGNFPEGVDRYEATRAMMPYAKAVSAKCYDFDERGEETTIDFARMMRIVVDAGYHGYVGIEYEGDRLSEHDGIVAAKRLLERVGETLATGLTPR